MKRVAQESYQTSEGTFGQVKIADEVISSIAVIAAKDVEGVKDTVGSNTNELVNRFVKKDPTKGVKTSIINGNIVVDISLILCYGYSIKETSNKVQEKIKRVIENMTGFNVTDVNIKIASIDVK